MRCEFSTPHLMLLVLPVVVTYCYKAHNVLRLCASSMCFAYVLNLCSTSVVVRIVTRIPLSPTQQGSQKGPSSVVDADGAILGQACCRSACWIAADTQAEKVNKVLCWHGRMDQGCNATANVRERGLADKAGLCQKLCVAFNVCQRN